MKIFEPRSDLSCRSSLTNERTNEREPRQSGSVRFGSIRFQRRARPAPTMFGRVRAPPSPIDSLDRPPSKILKDDSLSIYEVTLVKLREGSQRRLISPPVAESDIVTDSVSGTSSSCLCDDELMVVDTDCSSTSPSSTSIDCPFTDSSGPKQDKNISTIVHLFSKFKGYQLASSSGNQMVTMEKDGSSISVSSEGQSSSITME